MGIFDKLKKIQNFMEGRGANLSIYLAKKIHEGNQPIMFKVGCKVEDADITINKAYLKVKAIEKVVVQNVEQARQKGKELETRKEDVNGSHLTYCEKFILAGPQVLEANQTYEWEIEVTLPAEVNATYKGYNASHEWSAYAGLDVDGNDPDSDWVKFEIRK